MQLGGLQQSMKSTAILLGIGLAMVIAMLVMTNAILGPSRNSQTTNPTTVEGPTPTPLVQYQPVPLEEEL